MKRGMIFLGALVLILLTSVVSAQNDANLDNYLIEGTLTDYASQSVMDIGLCIYNVCPAAELLYPRMLGINPETGYFASGAPGNSVITNWDISEDGLTYRFFLVYDRYWSDGTPITAADVAFSLEAEDYSFDFPVDVRIIDDFTVDVTFPTADCGNLNRVDVRVVPSFTFASVDDYLTEGIFAPEVTYGPFQYRGRSGDLLILDANPNYHDPVQLDGYAFRTVDSQEAMIDALENGEIHYMRDVPLPYQTQIEDNADLQNYAYAGNVWDYVGLNVGSRKNERSGMTASGNYIANGSHAILGNRNVRRALQYAIDVDQIIDTVYGGHAVPMPSYLPPSSWAYDRTLPRVGYNPNEAIRILEAEGWFLGEDGVRVRNGNRYNDGDRLQISLFTNANNNLRAGIVAILSEQFADIGVAVDVELLDFISLLDNMDESTFDTYVLGWLEEFPDNPAPIYFSAQNQSTSSLNYGSYQIDAVEAMSSTEEATDRNYNTFCSYESQRARFATLQREISEYQPYLWIATRNTLVAARDLIGFDPRPNMPLWNIENIQMSSAE